MNKEQVRQKKLIELEALEIIRPNAGGLDLGSQEHYAAIGKHKIPDGGSNICVFATHQEGLESMASWFLEHGITSVAMEATGVYWIGAYEVLESVGIEVCLVNPWHLKNVAGRKSDEKDSQWIQRLHTYGLLKASFVPVEVMRDLRSYIRHRQNLEEEKKRAMQHIHKALDMMNLKVHYRIANLDGKTGMNIVRAIANGENDPKKLSAYHTRFLKVSPDELELSLKGNYKAAHVFALTQAVERYDFMVEQMKKCDARIESALAIMVGPSMDPAPTMEPQRATKRKVKKNDYNFDVKSYLQQMCGVDLTAIDGLQDKLVLSIISEIGLNLNKWPTAQHFTAWLGLAPRQKITGGKVKGHFRNKGMNRAGKAFCKGAFALANSKSALGAFYRKLRGRRGGLIANMATARKIAVIFYHMMTKKVPYQKTMQEDYEQKHKHRRIHKLYKEAEKLGFKLEIATP